MKRKTNYGAVIALMLAGAGGVAAVGMYVKNTPDAAQIPPALRRSSLGHEAQKVPVRAKDSAEILIPRSSGGNLSFEKSTEKVPTGADPMVFAINRYLENTHFAKGHALSCTVVDGLAHIEFDPAFQSSYGSSDEETLLQGLSKTLGQFPEVKKMQFFINGSPVESIGNVDLSQPLDVTIPAPDATQA